MRPLRIVACVLALWAVAALLFSGLEVRTWFRTPSPAEATMRKKERTATKLIAWAGIASGACLALDALIGRARRRTVIRVAAPSASPAAGGPLPQEPDRG